MGLVLGKLLEYHRGIKFSKQDCLCYTPVTESMGVASTYFTHMAFKPDACRISLHRSGTFKVTDLIDPKATKYCEIS